MEIMWLAQMRAWKSSLGGCISWSEEREADEIQEWMQDHDSPFMLAFYPQLECDPSI